MSRKAVSAANNTLVQGIIKKKCDRAYHRPGSNKGCANGTCQHTCGAAQVAECAHKWTVVYSVSSRQREQSFATLTEAQTFQLTLSTGKQTQGAMFTDPRAGIVAFLPLCGAYIDGMAKAGPRTKAIYRSNFANPAVTRLLRGKSVLEVARMDAEVKQLLNTTLGGYQDEYRGNVRRVITGTLDECVRRGTLPRHTLTGIELGPRVVTAAQYEAEQQRKRLIHLPDETVRMLADGLTVTTGTVRRRTWAIPGLGIAPWLQRTMGLRIREALGVRKADFKERADGTRYLHLCWQASPDGMELEPLKHRKAGEYRDVPVPDMVWDMVQALPDGPLCPGPKGTPYLPYNTAYSRFASLTGHLGISGAHTHMLRHQFATEALDENPRELANISQVLGHDSVETTLKFYIHPSADAEQRIGAMMNARWNRKPAPTPASRRTAAPASAAPMSEAA
jgi:integrase